MDPLGPSEKHSVFLTLATGLVTTLGLALRVAVTLWCAQARSYHRIKQE